MKHPQSLLLAWSFVSFIQIFSAQNVFAKVSFGGLDLSNDGRVLFQARYSGSGSRAQAALFESRLTDLSLAQLTSFPEKIELLENNRVIQVRNAFGCARLPISGGIPALAKDFPSFAKTASVTNGLIEEILVSANGKWMLRVEGKSAAYGDLVVVNVSSGEKTTVAGHVERPGKRFPAIWSPDSQVFIYEQNGSLYYYSVEVTAIQEERYRLIGEGGIASAVWGAYGDFFYLRGANVYRMRSAEMFFRSIYRDFLEIGTPIAGLPFSFDPNFDECWLSPDSKALLLSKGGRGLFYFPLDSANEAALPYLLVPESCFSIKVLWSSSNIITVITVSRKKTGAETLVFRLNPDAQAVFAPQSVLSGEYAALSPDGTKMLAWGDRGVYVYNYARWEVAQTISNLPAYACAWLGNDDFIVGDAARIQRVHLDGDRFTSALICLSSAEAFCFDETSNRILAKNSGAWFVTDGKSSWAAIENPQGRPASLVSGRYRVFLEPQASGPYENLPMLRNTTSVGTTPMFSPAYNPPLAAPAKTAAQSAPDSIFSHGNRNGPLEVSLCFDLYDDDTGVNQALEALYRFGIKATFFLNGEIIRQHPRAVRDIADAGHECASMFFAPMNLATSRYEIDRNFLARGLARTEDEFFHTTNAELKLLWHPPFYVASSDIIAIANGVGYKTIGRDVDPMDSFGKEDARRMNIPLYRASDMIDSIMAQKQPGSIIPIRLGLLDGGRDSYLFNRLDVLIDALIKAGYTIVPVSIIIEHTK